MNNNLTVDDLENILNLLNIIVDQELVEDAPNAYMAIITLIDKINNLVLLSHIEHLIDEQYMLAHLTTISTN